MCWWGDKKAVRKVRDLRFKSHKVQNYYIVNMMYLLKRIGSGQVAKEMAYQLASHQSTDRSNQSQFGKQKISRFFKSSKQIYIRSRPVFGSKIQNSKFFFRHLHGDLNLDEIKNTLLLLSVNGETNLMNLMRL